MSGEQIYLAARDCARGDQSKDLASPIDWRRKPSLLDRLRAHVAARLVDKAGAGAAEREPS